MMQCRDPFLLCLLTILIGFRLNQISAAAKRSSIGETLPSFGHSNSANGNITGSSNSSANVTTADEDEKGQHLKSPEVGGIHEDDDTVYAPANNTQMGIRKGDLKHNKKNNFVPGLTSQIFKNIDGYRVEDLQTAQKFPDSPDEERAISDLNVPILNLESFGRRVFGYFKPPLDGDYVFAISSNAESQLSISTNNDKRNLRKYAEVANKELVESNEFDKFPDQTSIPVQMKANEMYYIEVLHKELYGTNHLQVGARFPDGSKHFPIEGKFLFTKKDSAASATEFGIEQNGALDGIGGTDEGGSEGETAGNGAGDGATASASDGGPESKILNKLKGTNPLQAALQAGQNAGADQGAKAGLNAGEKAGKDAGQKAGAEAGLQAAAAALGMTVEELKTIQVRKEERAKADVIKIKLYAANFPCANPGGHVCKYALSAGEDDSVSLNPREEATVFLVRKPALNGKDASISLEVDAKRDYYLVRDGAKYIVSKFEPTKQFGLVGSFNIENKESVLPASSGLQMADKTDYYMCHATGTGEVIEAKFSRDCTFHLVHPDLDNNHGQATCKDYCKKEIAQVENEDNVNGEAGLNDIDSNTGNNGHIGTADAATMVESIRLVNLMAKKAAQQAAEKLLINQQHKTQILKVAAQDTISKLQAQTNLQSYSTEQAHAKLQTNLKAGLTSQPIKNFSVNTSDTNKPFSDGANKTIEETNVSKSGDNKYGGNSGENAKQEDTLKAEKLLIGDGKTERHASDGSHSWVVDDSNGDDDGNKFVAVRFLNQAFVPTKIVSNLRPSGYDLTTDRFKLKIVFKNKDDQRVSFHGVDLSGKDHPIFLDGKQSISLKPTLNQDNYVDIAVTSGPPNHLQVNVPEESIATTPAIQSVKIKGDNNGSLGKPTTLSIIHPKGNSSTLKLSTPRIRTHD